MRRSHQKAEAGLHHRSAQPVGTVVLIAACLLSIVPESFSDEPGLLPMDVQSDAAPVLLSLEAVFADRVNGSLVTRPSGIIQTSSESPVTTASFERPALVASFERPALGPLAVVSSSSGRNTEAVGHDRTHVDPWKPSAERLAGLSGVSGDRPTLTDLLPRLVGVTALVIIACAVSLWLARRWLTRNGMSPSPSSSSRLAVTATFSIAPHSHLHVVQVDGREFLAVVNSQGLQQVVAMPPAFEELVSSFDQQPFHEPVMPMSSGVPEQSRAA